MILFKMIAVLHGHFPAVLLNLVDCNTLDKSLSLKNIYISVYNSSEIAVMK